MILLSWPTGTSFEVSAFIGLERWPSRWSRGCQSASHHSCWCHNFISNSRGSDASFWPLQALQSCPPPPTPTHGVVGGELKGNFKIKMSPFLAVHSGWTAQSALFPCLPFSPTVVFFFYSASQKLTVSLVFTSEWNFFSMSYVMLFYL